MGLTEVECPEPVEGLKYIYILLCNGGSLYVGQTIDVETRIKLHKAGKGTKHTRENGVLSLVYTEGPLLPPEAAYRERQLKRWTRTKKLKLISGDL